jgi:16S rRNA (cytosine967-C5)-methyltransferase
VSAAPTRREALRTLLAVGAGEDLEHTLERSRRDLPPGEDPGFLTELVKGALQWQARYDHLVVAFSRRQPNADPRVLAILRLSLHQLLAMGGVPPYAAIHQAGELCRETGRVAAGGYVNGLLQAVHREAGAGDDRLVRLRPRFPDPSRQPVDFLAAWHSLPRWLVERWHARFGFVACEALLAHTNRPPPVCLHVLAPGDPGAAAEALAAAGAPTTPGRHHPRALWLDERGKRTTLRDWLDAYPGLIVQDEGIQAATAWLAQDLSSPVLDLCAAPGGKSVHLASLLPPDGSVVALDLRPRRLRRLQVTLGRLAEDRVHVVAGDGKQPPLRAGAFAAVLLDGPCSGTGVIRHHPEGRWRLQPEVLVRNAARLLELARAAADLLAPGGRLYYATCSLEPQENEEVVDALLASRPDLAPAPAADGLSRRAWLPHETGTDGFFAARLCRRGPAA